MPTTYTLQTKAKGAAKLREWLRDEFETTPEQIETLSEMLDDLVAECLGVETPDPFDKGLNTKGVPAMDSATRAAMRHMNTVRQAEADVRPVIGEVAPQTSAAAVYKMALDAMGVDLTGVARVAYADVFRTARQTNGGRSRPAMDSASAKGFAERFPNAARIRQG